jgi:hypothetical protein
MEEGINGIAYAAVDDVFRGAEDASVFLWAGLVGDLKVEKCFGPGFGQGMAYGI